MTTLPLHVPTAIPFTLLKAPPAAHRSGDSRLNWDGTPAQWSGARSRKQGGPEAGRWRQRGGEA